MHHVCISTKYTHYKIRCSFVYFSYKFHTYVKWNQLVMYNTYIFLPVIVGLSYRNRSGVIFSTYYDIKFLLQYMYVNSYSVYV